MESDEESEQVMDFRTAADEEAVLGVMTPLQRVLRRVADDSLWRTMTRDEARAALSRLAAGVREETEEEAAARLLERVASAAPELRDVLLEAGARAVLREGKP